METFLDGRVALHEGDCLAVLPNLPAESFDACVCDPPYHLTSIVKRFGKPGSAEAKSDGATGVYKRASSGFMGKSWDGGDIAFRPETWTEVLRVLKPGAHLVAFAAPKNAHRLTCAIEDAGFEIRDVIMWLYGQGFPKSLNVGKMIDKAGAEREITGVAGKSGSARSCMAGDFTGGEYMATAPATDEAAEWDGWGTALKPAYEPIILARKPLIGTVAANVLAAGTGALNIDACRVGERERPKITDPKHTSNTYGKIESPGGKLLPDGRWPANVCHDGSAEVIELFPQSAGQQGDIKGTEPSQPLGGAVYGHGLGRQPFKRRDGESSADRRYDDHGGTNFAMLPGERRNDLGSAARFFYCAKATAADRLGSKHPTVKPIKLMRWLVRMVTRKDGLIIDPFAGTGTMAEAAIYEGMRAVLIENDPESIKDIQLRMRMLLAGPEEREREILKIRGKVDPFETTELGRIAA